MIPFQPYLTFSLLFMVIYTGAYIAAGATTLRISRDIYEGKARLMDYLNDMGDTEERSHVSRWFFPANLLRGLLLSLIVWPVLIPLGGLELWVRSAFFFLLLFLATHLASAAPCPDNIEGFVYLKRRYFSWSAFGRFQFEMITYSLLAAILTAWLLF